MGVAISLASSSLALSRNRPGHSAAIIRRAATPARRGACWRKKLCQEPPGRTALRAFDFDMASSDLLDRTYVLDRGLRRLLRERKVFQDPTWHSSGWAAETPCAKHFNGFTHIPAPVLTKNPVASAAPCRHVPSILLSLHPLIGLALSPRMGFLVTTGKKIVDTAASFVILGITPFRQVARRASGLEWLP